MTRYASQIRLNRRDLTKTMLFSAGAVAFAGYGRAPAAAQDATRLVQWYHEYGEAGTQDAVMRYAQQYTEENPDVEIEVVWQAGDYATTLNTTMLAGEGPDIFELGGPPTVEMVRAGWLAPLDDLFTEEIRQDFHPIDLEVNSIDGSIYGIKMVVDTGLLYYRTSMLEEAGVTQPTNFDELFAAAQTLNSGRVKGLFIGNDGYSSMNTIMPWSANSDFLVDNEIVFDNEQTVAAYERLRELYESDVLLIGAPADWHDPSAFIQGLTAIQWTGLWAMPAIQDQLGDDFTVSAWPPLGNQGVPATFRGGWAELVNAASPNLDAAKQYVKWLWIDNTELQRDWNLEYGFHIPPRRSAVEEAEVLQDGPPAQGVEALNEGGRTLSPLWTGAMGTALGDALTAIVRDGEPAAERVTAAAELCREELARVLGE